MTDSPHSELVEEIRQGISHAYTLELFERLVEQLEAIRVICEQAEWDEEGMADRILKILGYRASAPARDSTPDKSGDVPEGNDGVAGAEESSPAKRPT